MKKTLSLYIFIVYSIAISIAYSVDLGDDTKPLLPFHHERISGDLNVTLTFQDEFNGTSLDTNNWVVMTTVGSGYTTGDPYIACYVDSPNNVYVANGDLHLTVLNENTNFSCNGIWTNFTAGEVDTLEKFSQTYGIFEVRARIPDVRVPGLQETFWLWPVHESLDGVVWPASGEIDFAEFYSQYPHIVVPFLHYNASSPNQNITSYSYDCFIDLSSYNVFQLIWTPYQLTINVNNYTCFYDDWNPAPPLQKPQPFSRPFFITLTQALGVGTNAYQPGITPLPATTQIDYVRVWQFADAD